MTHTTLTTLLLLTAAASLRAQPLARGDGRVVTASHGTLAEAPAPAAVGAAAASMPDEMTAAAAMATAGTLVGARYRYGGQSPTRGFDCSGFVRYVYAAHGVPLPRTAHEMSHAGVPVARDTAALRPGDLLLFRLRKRGRVDHVAIYAGDGRIVHAASRRRKFVRYDELATERGQYYMARLVAVRRVIDPPTPFAATAAGQSHYMSWSGGVPKP